MFMVTVSNNSRKGSYIFKNLLTGRSSLEDIAQSHGCANPPKKKHKCVQKIPKGLFTESPFWDEIVGNFGPNPISISSHYYSVRRNPVGV